MADLAQAKHHRKPQFLFVCKLKCSGLPNTTDPTVARRHYVETQHPYYSYPLPGNVHVEGACSASPVQLATAELEERLSRIADVFGMSVGECTPSKVAEYVRKLERVESASAAQPGLAVVPLPGAEQAIGAKVERLRGLLEQVEVLAREMGQDAEAEEGLAEDFADWLVQVELQAEADKEDALQVLGKLRRAPAGRTSQFLEVSHA